MKNRHRGIYTNRFIDHPMEKEFAEAWEEFAERNLGYLLDQRPVQTGRALEPSDRDCLVAATVIQWLGSHVGQNWLRDRGCMGASEDHAMFGRAKSFVVSRGLTDDPSFYIDFAKLEAEKTKKGLKDMRDRLDRILEG